jgi:acyl-CoA reductase-like NAD-dependent aldehyde dehydrogenase
MQSEEPIFRVEDHPVYRDGAWRTSGEWLEVNSPYDDRLVGRVSWDRPEAAFEAVAAAAGAMENPLPPHERSEILARTARIMAERAELLAQTICAEAGKPISLARLETARAVTTVEEASYVARHITGEVIPVDGVAAGAGHTALTFRVPVGVVAAITPFNFPLNLSAHKLAPAIAAGCAVVHKPADKTPLTALELARCFEDAGLPAGWLNLVVAEPVATSQILLDSPEVGLITFTGSASVGWGIARRAERTRVSLELGNSTPVIVTESADLERAARITAGSAFAFSGQACVSAQRVLVDRRVHDDFVGLLHEYTEATVTGDPRDPGTVAGPVITEQACDRILTAIDDALHDGASLQAGGGLTDGNVIEPTLLTGVDPDSDISCLEVFGPVLAVSATADFDESIRRANATDYGLQAALFTRSLEETQAGLRALNFGGVIVNDAPSWRVDTMPYGGTKASGNSKEGPAYAALEMTEEKLVVLAD